MAKLHLSIDAKNDINEILANVTEFTSFSSSAEKLLNEFRQTFNRLSLFPYSGKSIDDQLRETFCRGYRIVYEIIDDEIYILTVIHSRRLYPRP